MTEQSPKHRLRLSPPLIIVDTREQRPLFSRRRREPGERWTCDVTGAECVSAAIPEKNGDYQLFGVGDRWATIERKSLSDFIGSIQRKDFIEEEIPILSQYRFAVVLVEADWRDLRGEGEDIRSMILPESITGLFMKITMRWPTVHAVPVGSHLAAKCFAHQWLRLAWRYYHDERHGGKHYYG